MTVCVYVGPTVAARDVTAIMDATCLPPVKQGDVYRAVSMLRPRAIGIIDGYFQAVPSVWHKEILWAMREGVHVFGAASMGALRAAELAPLGMHGVGRIFEAYRDGVLAGCGDEPFEDDDEVAVIHAPPEAGYLAVSEAMVNIRCTLAVAEEEGVIDTAVCASLVRIAKDLFFPDRSFERVLSEPAVATLPAAQLVALRAWLPAGRVNQKRDDALLMLGALRKFLAHDPAPAKAGFAFEHTTLWNRAISSAAPVSLHDPGEKGVLDELRLEGGRFDVLRREALHALAGGPAEAMQGIAPELLARSVAAHHMQPHAVERVFEEAARAHAARRLRDDIPAAVIERKMLAAVRESQDFSSLEARGVDKLAVLGAARAMPDIEAFSHIQLLQLTDWYFSEVLGEDMPDDLERWVRERGYDELLHFHRAIFAEYVYREMKGENMEPAREAAGA